MRIRIARVLPGVCAGLALAHLGLAGPLPPPVQNGDWLRMTNGHVRLEYNLATGRANFYWQDALKVAGFYAGVGLYSGVTLTNYVTGTVYLNRAWSVTNNTVVVTSTRADLPTMKQTFILDEDDSFLTRVEMQGSALESRWMGPVVMDTTGGVDLGSYDDNRALIVPFDNDSFTFSYNAMPINNTSTSYEVSAFYDNTSRHGLVVGSVTHDTWKTGIYFQGANARLNVLNVFGGVTSSDTRDVEPHGLVTGNTIVSPTVFVGCGADWRTVLEDFAVANTRFAPRLTWNGGVPFGWNSWYAYGTSVNYDNATAVANFIKSDLQTNHFLSQGTVYINLDSFWDNMSTAQLAQFVNVCHGNGQKAGIYWTPFVFWGTPAQGSNWTMTASSVYKWSDAYLRTAAGSPQVIDSGVAIDPTHPGFQTLVSYQIGYFKSLGFDYLKLDFLSHGALEGTHYDPNVTTGIQAYNLGMQYLVNQNNGRMFLSESIAPIFPYQYAHARRIYCDTAGSINDTKTTMQAINYGWWLNGRLYQFNDPDMSKLTGFTANENQSRIINCAVAGTVFLNSDDLTSAAAQSLARNCLTKAGINEVARAGVSFRPIEGNTGADASDVFVRQDGATWYVAVFNYSSSSTVKILNLARLGITGTYTAVDLWTGAATTVSGATWNVGLGARQARLFRLGSGNTSAIGPSSQALVVGNATTFNTAASGTPPFTYEWRKNGVPLSGANANALTINSTTLNDAGVYTVIVTGPNGVVTNHATLALSGPTTLSAQLRGDNLVLDWLPGYTGWRLQARATSSAPDWDAGWSIVTGSEFTNCWFVPVSGPDYGRFFRLISP